MVEIPVIEVPPADYQILTQALSGRVFHKKYPAPDYRCFITSDGTWPTSDLLKFLDLRGIDYKIHKELPPYGED